MPKYYPGNMPKYYSTKYHYRNFIIADKGDTINGSKYSVSKNPSTGLYYRLQYQSRPLLPNSHCRTASSPCTTYTGVGLDTLLVQ
jgi:hypothetical protein